MILNLLQKQISEVYYSQKREERRDKHNLDDGYMLNSTFN